ncbi:MAG: PAS domain S-box protein, partial [Bacteroidales bacterium]
METNRNQFIPININEIEFADIFDIKEIQRIQDLFSDANGVASIITNTDGTPITKPSNFCRLCNDIIRKTEKGLANCFKSDAIIGRQNSTGPISQPCLSGGLWDAGASITIGGKHIANWLIGQVRSKELDKMNIIQYADEIGANRNDFLEALNEVPFMPEEQFKKIAEMLYAFANELSAKAYNNLQLKIQIAETEKAKKISQISEEKFRLLIDLAADAFFQGDAVGNFIEVNKAASELTAYTREELLKMNMKDLFSSNILNNKPLRYDLLLKGDTIISEREIIRKDGASVFVEMNSKKMPDGNFQSFFRNITERKQILDTLKESEIKYRDLVENSPDAIVIYEEGKTVFVNNECLRLIKASCEEELIGKPVIQFVHPDYRPMVISRMKQLDTEGLILPTYEEKFICLDGTVIDVEVKAMSLKLHDKVAVQLIIRDVFERKNAENALRESKDKFKAIANFSASWEAWFNPEGKLLWMNSFTETLTGFTPEEYIAAEDFISMTVFSEDIPLGFEKYQEAINGGSGDDLEVRCLRKDGSYFWASISWCPILDSNGKSLGFRTSTQDISKRKHAEELVRQKQKQLSDIIEFLPDATLAIDKEKRIIIWNKAIVEMTGIPASEMMGKGNYAYTIPFYGEARSQLMDLVFENNEEVIARYPHIKRDGDTLTAEFFCNALYNNKGAWIFAKVSPLHDEDGNIIGAIESLRDITQSKQANDLLKESERKLSTLMNNLQGMAYSCLNDKDWTIKFVNEGSFNLTEYLPEELIKNKIISFHEISHPDDRKMVSLVVEDAIKNKTSYALEYRIVTKRGFLKYVWDQGQVVFNFEGSISHFEGFITDITERKHAERALKESEERFRLGFDYANVGMSLIDIKGKFLKVNQHFCDMLGYNISEMDDMKIIDVTHPDDIDTSQLFIKKALNGEIDHSEFEKSYIHKHGKLVLSRVAFSLVRNADGNPMYFISHIIDITERKQAEQAIKESEERFRAVSEFSFSSICIINEAGKIILANDAMIKMGGYSKEQIYAADTFATFLAPESKEFVVANFM